MEIHSTSFGLACDSARPSHDAFAVKTWDQTLIAVLADGTGSGAAARKPRSGQCVPSSITTRRGP